MQPICNQRIKHVSILSSQSRELLMNTIPEVVKRNPLRYPFLFPTSHHGTSKNDSQIGWEYLWKMKDPDELRNSTLCEMIHHNHH